MTTTRRDLLKTLPVLVGSAAIADSAAWSAEKVELVVSPASATPLHSISVRGASKGTIVIEDGEGREYLRQPATDPFEFVAGGALGRHAVKLFVDGDRLVATAGFDLNCETTINDAGERFSRLLKILRWTMETWEHDSPIFVGRFNQRVYHYFVPWLRDNTHSMKGMKYFWSELKEAVNLYTDTQRADGMIFDNISRRTPEYSYWDWVLEDGDFILRSNDSLWEMKRQPVEADVEYLYLEALYFTWKATGDHKWMAARLDNALKAVHYATNNPYRWSAKYQLVKRAYTIDTWDFVPQGERIRDQNQLVDLKQTQFGIMFGDNTGLMAGCRYLAEMLESAGRTKEAAEQRNLADTLQRQLNAVSWNGQHFRHHVPEDPNFKRDFGVDEAEQVSLSNAYSLNRGISHEQAAAIIRTYQQIRNTMPTSSPGEFYAIYPPFRKGFDAEDQLWEYMNGGVLSLVAGELARGAFLHGFEGYGADILLRQLLVGEKHDGFLPVTLRGKTLESPKRSFVTLNLAEIANVDTGNGAPGVVGWMNEPGNDLSRMPTGKQVFQDVKFDIVDPSTNGRRACLGISTQLDYKSSAELPVHQKAASVYLLHTRDSHPLAGVLRFRYVDGSTHCEYLDATNSGHWWEPRDAANARVAWRGANQKFGNLGVYVSGFNNPHPEREIGSLRFEALENAAKWIVLGVTLCDTPVFFMPKDDVSFGIPDIWGAAAVTYALVEGLAGVRDEGVKFSPASVSPRWLAAGVDSAEVAIRYAASNGYVAYRYHYDQPNKKIVLDFTGNAEKAKLAFMIPPGLKPGTIRLDGVRTEGITRMVEASRYCYLSSEGLGAHRLELELEPEA